MAVKTDIEWANATWNPWQGCHKVSAGCKNCYMFRDQERFGKDPSVVRRSKSTFNDPLRWADPFKKHDLYPGAKIFTCSFSDWFIEEADQWRAEAWEIIRKTPQFIYIILTKRPERIRDNLPNGWPFKNVWLLVSTENQKAYNERWPILEKIQAPVRGISAEPLLGEIQMHHSNRPDWVISGGESGPMSRSMDSMWADYLQYQCEKFSIPFFHKQNGGNRKIDGHWGGNLLCGRAYQEFPK